MVHAKDYNQLKFEFIKTPFEHKVDKENRWIRLAQLIPWNDFAALYNSSFNSPRGRSTIDARVAVGAMIIKHRLNISDEETIEQIKENPYLQYFLGFSEYEYKQPFAASLFVEIRRRLGKDKIRLMTSSLPTLSSGATSEANRNDEDDDESGQDQQRENKGTLIIDATVAGQKMAYPTDFNMLNQVRESSEKIIDELHKLTKYKVKPRTYRVNARKHYLAVAKRKRLSAKGRHRAIKAQLNFIKRNFKTIEAHLDEIAKKQETLRIPLSRFWLKRYWVIQQVYAQQLQMHKSGENRCDDRIVSLSQPHIRPIIRGKKGKKVEFGAKIGFRLCNGYSTVDTISWNAYNESADLVKHVEHYFEENGCYPEKVLADPIYGTRENRKYLNKNDIIFGGKPLGRPKKETEENKAVLRAEKAKRKQMYQGRIPIEGKFGQGKNAYGLDNIAARTLETSESWIAMIFLVMSLVKLAKDFLRLLFFTYLKRLINCYIFHTRKLYSSFCAPLLPVNRILCAHLTLNRF